jgi:hypothetical protein
VWFLHAVEMADRHWACRHGLRELDSHTELGDALSHLRREAMRGPGAFKLIVHWLDGRIDVAEHVDAPPQM